MVNLHKGSEENLNSKVRHYDFIKHMKNSYKHLEDADSKSKRMERLFKHSDEPRVIAITEETVEEITLSIHPVAFCLSSWHDKTTFHSFPSI